MKSAALIASLLGFAALASATAPAVERDALSAPPSAKALRHRRHGHRRRKHKRGCNTLSVSANATAAVSPTVVGSYPSNPITVNGVYFGMLPDGGTDGGSRDTMSSLDALVSSTGKKHALYGQYAQAHSGTAFDGSQLLQVLDDLKKSGSIFEPAVMPTNGWGGLTDGDNSQAVNICNVMKKFTDQGIEVRLRFAHEVNYYQTDGTYQGGVSDFKAGWKAVSTACKTIAPEVKMFFTPNVASLAEYDKYYPDDKSSVDFIGIDYYPHQDEVSTGFLKAMKPFHDKYASESTRFAIGETGLGFAGSVQQRIEWAQSAANARTSGMQWLESVTWFNYQKGYNFKILDPNDQSMTSAYIKFISA